MIESQFPTKSSSKIVESVIKFKLDQNYALYYLMVQNAISRGKRVKFDISSKSFEKRKKKVASIRLRKLSENYRKIPTENEKIDNFQVEIFGRKSTVRVRPSLVSIEVTKRQLTRNDSGNFSTHQGR